MAETLDQASLDQLTMPGQKGLRECSPSIKAVAEATGFHKGREEGDGFRQLGARDHCLPDI
jgi:hypothetical protein